MGRSERVRQVVAGCKAGEPEAFSQLVDLYASRCYGYFYRLTGNKDVSDELLSELFVKLLEKIKTFKGTAFDRWLFKVAGNIFYDYLRKRQREKKLLEQKKAELLAEPKADEKPEFDLVDKLQKQLGRLDDETRELIVLRFYSQLSFREIAYIKDKPIGTVLAKVHRGLKTLQGRMKGGL